MKLPCYLTFDDGPYPNTSNVLNVLLRAGVKATFFLTGENMVSAQGQQYRLVKRMIDEGHAIGNHGYDHDPATRRSYKASSTRAVQDDFVRNDASFRQLFAKKYEREFPGFTCARLPGDGRFMTDYVSMISNEVKLPHVGWNVEFSTNGLMGHVSHRDWQGVSGVACTHSDFPAGNDILLLHDRHWNGKDALLKALIDKLKEQLIFRTLNPVPTGHSAIRYP